MNDKLEQLEYWITKEKDNSQTLVSDVILGKHHVGMVAAYTRVLRKIEEIKKDGEPNEDFKNGV